MNLLACLALKLAKNKIQLIGWIEQMNSTGNYSKTYELVLVSSDCSEGGLWKSEALVTPGRQDGRDWNGCFFLGINWSGTGMASVEGILIEWLVDRWRGIRGGMDFRLLVDGRLRLVEENVDLWLVSVHGVEYYLDWGIVGRSQFNGKCMDCKVLNLFVFI